MAKFEGSLRLPDEHGVGLRVEIHLDDEVILVATEHEVLGVWPMDRVTVRATDDGFWVRFERDEVLIRTADDARFALALGLHAVPPRLRRRMAAALRPENRDHPSTP